MSQLSNSPPSPVKYVRLIFFLVIIAYFMDIIDASIVTVALPSIRLEFGASIANSQWIYGAYAITLAGFLLLMGRAGDTYGQKKIFVGGLIHWLSGIEAANSVRMGGRATVTIEASIISMKKATSTKKKTSRTRRADWWNLVLVGSISVTRLPLR